MPCCRLSAPVFAVMRMLPAIGQRSLVRPVWEDSGRLGPGGRKGAEYDPFSSAEPGSSAKMECRSRWRPVYAEERLARRDGCVRGDPRAPPHSNTSAPTG